MTKPLRLDAYLATAGIATRRDAKRLVRRGGVTVNGETIRDASTVIPRESDVRHDGKPVILPPTELHVLLHKPPGYACSRDEREAPLIFELFPDAWRGLIEPAGRLDRATSGMLICSSDGSIIHRLISPKRKVAKRYRIRYAGTLTDDAITQCAGGMTLPDDPKPLAPAQLTIHSRCDDLGAATLEIYEGRFHQVRRMIVALGGEVMHLHRDRIGSLELPSDLKPGQWREINGDQLNAAQTRLSANDARDA